MHLREGDFVGARWRQGWVQDPVSWVSSLPTAAGTEAWLAVHHPAASYTALHATSGRLGYQQNWLHQRQLLAMLKKSH